MLSNMDSRNRSIIKYYLISIILNLILSVLKLIIGITAHSRAIVLDAINGFSDMMSAGIAILSAVATSRKANKAHPLGFGRLEYLSSMIMTGTDGMGDALISASILAAIIILRDFDLNIEPYLCILISLSILGTSISMLRECMGKIISERPDTEFERRIKKILIAEDGVLDVCNLVIHTYGENTSVGSVDIEVDESTPAAEIHESIDI